MAKYKLTKETRVWCGITLYQIEATASFGSVEKGEKGGYIEKEENLSQYDNAWVSGNAWVYGNARVSGNARVYGKLKLEAGFFFGVKWSSDTEIKQVEIENGNFLVYKGEAKFGEEERKMSDAELIAELEKRGVIKQGKIVG